jgi:hypothetical protein
MPTRYSAGFHYQEVINVRRDPYTIQIFSIEHIIMKKSPLELYKPASSKIGAH